MQPRPGDDCDDDDDGDGDGDDGDDQLRTIIARVMMSFNVHKDNTFEMY